MDEAQDTMQAVEQGMNEILEHFTAPDPDAMYCQICTKLIDKKRAARATSVCSEKCKNKLDGIRARQRANRKCHACLHPSSPAERAEFRQWRFERGDIKSATLIVRDYSLPEKTSMANMLKSTKLFLEHEADAVKAQLTALDAEAGKGIPEAESTRQELQAKLEKLTVRIRDIAYLVDRKPA